MRNFAVHHHPDRLNAFPVFMRVEDRIVVIVGGGEEALAKARLLSQSSARLRIEIAGRSTRMAPKMMSAIT